MQVRIHELDVLMVQVTFEVIGDETSAAADNLWTVSDVMTPHAAMVILTFRPLSPHGEGFNLVSLRAVKVSDTFYW